MTVVVRKKRGMSLILGTHIVIYTVYVVIQRERSVWDEETKKHLQGKQFLFLI